MTLVEILSAAADRLSEASTSYTVGYYPLCRERLASLGHFLEVELSALPAEEPTYEQQPEKPKNNISVEEDRPSPKVHHLAGEEPSNQ